MMQQTYLKKSYPNLAEYMYPLPGEARLFKNPITEKTLTKTPGWIPAVIYLPLVVYLTNRSVALVSIPQTLLGWATGVVIWTLAE